MTHHYLPANDSTVHWGFFSRSRGAGERQGVHVCTGPVAVRGAEPGDVLEVRILDVRPRPCANPRYAGKSFGSNAAAWWGFHYEDLLTEPRPREVITIWTIPALGTTPQHDQQKEECMIKVVVLLRRPQSWTLARFHRWWLDEHVPYAKVLPGLRKYRVCLVTGSTSHEGREPWDGIAELWFESRAALDAAWSSEVGRTALEHSRESHSDRLVLITEEHELIG